MKYYHRKTTADFRRLFQRVDKVDTLAEFRKSLQARKGEADSTMVRQ